MCVCDYFPVRRRATCQCRYNWWMSVTLLNVFNLQFLFPGGPSGSEQHGSGLKKNKHNITKENRICIQHSEEELILKINFIKLTENFLSKIFNLIFKFWMWQPHFIMVIRSVDIYFERSVDFYFEQLHSCYSFWEKICNFLKNDSAAGGEIHSFIVIKVLLHSHWRNVTCFKILLQNQKKKKQSIENSKQLHISRQQKQNETWKELQTGYNQVKMSDLYMNFNFIRRQESLQIILNSLIEFWSSNAQEITK